MIQVNFDESRLTAIVKQAIAEALSDMPKTDTSFQPERKTLHSIRELSEFLDCSTVTAQKFKNEGRIPYKQIGRKVMFDTAEVLKAMGQTQKKNRK